MKLLIALAFLGSASAIWDISEQTDEQPVIDLPPLYDINEVDTYLDMNVTNINLGTNCKRTCVAGQARICYYKFYVEHYQSMGAACGNCSLGNTAHCFNPQCITTDGYEKNVMTINRQLPGPHIEACENDIIVVDVINLLHAESVSIHWHGILQKLTPYMDGVPYATQCPINPHTTFRYRFLADTKGTFFYHSHSGIQRSNGFYGGLTVRAAADSSRALYDRDDYPVILADWSHTAPELFMAGLPTRPPGLLPEGMLINGKGRDMNSNTSAQTPFEVFYLTRGLRHRFRFVNAGSSVCPMQVQFQNHRMHIISTDGNNVNPSPIDTLVLTTGERFDVVINANQTSSNVFWMHVKLIGACTARNIFQTAILSYNPPVTSPGGPTPPPRATYQGYPLGITLNDQVVNCGADPNYICHRDLKAPESPDLWNRQPDMKLYWTFTVKQMDTASFFSQGAYVPFFNIFGQNIFMGTMNDVSFLPPSSPLLSQPAEVDTGRFCGENGRPSYCNNMQICACTQLVNLTRNSLVEIVLIDQATVPSLVVHPIHIHGFKFIVMNQGQFANPGTALTVAKIKEYEAAGLLKGNNTDCPTKDTISVHNQGYAVIRFIADNPGAWLVHCHVEDHMTYGMGLMLVVPGIIPPVPAGFPKCGSFI